MNWQYARKASFNPETATSSNQTRETNAKESKSREASYRKPRKCTFENLSARELMAADLAAGFEADSLEQDDAPAEVRTIESQNADQSQQSNRSNRKRAGSRPNTGDARQRRVGPIQNNVLRNQDVRDRNAGRNTDRSAERAVGLLPQSFEQGSSLSGRVFVDANQNGLFENEDSPLSGSIIVLSGVTLEGEFFENKVEVDEKGSYEFTELEPGTYKLQMISSTKASAGNNYVGTLGGQLVYDGIDAIEIPKGGEHHGEEYNFTQSSFTWISGRVFLDADGNGSMEGSEQGIAGVELRLTGETETGQKIQRVTRTDGFGNYWFFNLPAGVYSLKQIQPDGLADGAEIVGTAGGHAEPNGFSKITAQVGQPGEGYLFGELSTSSIEGSVYLDIDQNDQHGSTDGPIAGLQVILSGIDDQGDAVRRETTTDFDGIYRFEDLRPGVYSLESEIISGFDVGSSTIGTFQSGTSVNYGFTGIQIPAGGTGLDYNIGHTDPKQIGGQGDRQLVLNGGDAEDQFEFDFSSDTGKISFNGGTLELSPEDDWTVRVLGSFGADTARVLGSAGNEDLGIRESSASLHGSWFNVLFYGIERFEFTGEGGEDLARFYDSPGDDSFVLEPGSATWNGDGFAHSANGFNRMYVYGGQGGSDTAELSGGTGRDNFVARPGDSKLYSEQSYIRVVDIEKVSASANEAEDRAYLHGDQSGDDALFADSEMVSLSGTEYAIAASGFSYTLASAGVGGSDNAQVQGSEADDQFRSEHTTSIWDQSDSRLVLKGFEAVNIAGGGGNDQARLAGSHLDEHLVSDHGVATLASSAASVTIQDFETVDVFGEGGQDTAAVRGGAEDDVFRGWSDRWSLVGSGQRLIGRGFERVTATATDSSDIAYLYDSAGDDALDMWSDRAILAGEGFENAAVGFGRVVAEGFHGGTDRATFHDDSSRSTVRYNGDRLTVFGRGFSNNAKGFEVVDAIYETLEGNDRVEFSGDLDIELTHDEIEELYRLRLAAGTDGQDDTLRDRVSEIPLS
ncbi:MAG: collagen binding domain-containing protein [Aureliella sp.]